MEEDRHNSNFNDELWYSKAQLMLDWVNTFSYYLYLLCVVIHVFFAISIDKIMIQLFKGRSNMAHIMKCKPIPNNNKVTTSSMLSPQPTKQRRRNIYKQKTTKHVYAKAYQKCEQQKNEDVAFIIYIEAASKYEAQKKEGSNNKQCAVSIVDEVNKKH